MLGWFDMIFTGKNGHGLKSYVQCARIKIIVDCTRRIMGGKKCTYHAQIDIINIILLCRHILLYQSSVTEDGVPVPEGQGSTATFGPIFILFNF